jgi:hypothetical protein
MNKIVLKQKPVIQHQLQAAGAEFEQMIKDLNIDKLVATEDTIKSIKATRASIRKKYAGYAEQRKLTETAASAPIVAFRDDFKECITDKFIPADETLKKTIDSWEMQIKDEKKKVIEDYLNELCASEKIDYLTFEQLGLTINLSTTEKAYKEKVNEFIDKVKDDVLLIDSEEYAAEIFVEYKKTLNASQSITTVRERKKAEEEEAERLRQKQIIDRQNAVKALGFQYVSFTNTWNFNDQIYFSNDEIENLERKDFKEKYLKFEAEIAEFKKAKQAENYDVSYVAEAPKQGSKEVLQAPTTETAPVKKISASFTAYGTMEELRNIGQYMKDNGIEYKNI